MSETTPERPTPAAGEVPNPGSDPAYALGCTCPRMDNGHGVGARGTSGATAIFYLRAECPVHFPAPRKDDPDAR